MTLRVRRGCSRAIPAAIALLLALAAPTAIAQGLPALTSTPAPGGGQTYSLTLQTLLFLTALDMLFERRTERRENQGDGDPPHHDPSVFPLAMPLHIALDHQLERFHDFEFQNPP